MTAEQCEQRVLAALEQARLQLSEALVRADDGGNVFSVLGEEVHVDQARQVVVDASGTPDNWIVRDGKRSLATARVVDRGMLSLFVGGNRFLPTEAVFFFLTDIAGGKALRNTGNFPTFLNVFVMEGMIHPERELPIWVTAARLLESKRDVDLHTVLPPLHTDFDVFHAELPAAEEPSHKLRPSNEPRESWATYKLRLVEELTGSNRADASTDEEHVRLQEPELCAYVREHLFARVAKALEAANGRYVLRSPFEEELDSDQR